MSWGIAVVIKLQTRIHPIRIVVNTSAHHFGTGSEFWRADWATWSPPKPISTALDELLAGLADAACPADIARLEGVVWWIQIEAQDVAHFLNEGSEASRIA